MRENDEDAGDALADADDGDRGERGERSGEPAFEVGRESDAERV